MFNKPLYDNKSNESDKNVESDLQIFCKAFGWQLVNGIVPMKVEKKRQNKWIVEDIDWSDVHKDFTKTNVVKEMRSCVLKGIERKHDLKKPTEREALRARRVIFFLIIFIKI